MSWRLDRSAVGWLCVFAFVAFGQVAALAGQNCERPFAAPWSLSAGDQPTSVVVGDIDGDGDADVVIANESSHSLTISTSVGGGRFETSTIGFVFGTSPRGLVGADFDGDGDLDLAFVQTFVNQVWVLKNSGRGSFSAPAVYTTGGSGSESLSVADMDGDGDVDLAVTNFFSNTVALLRNDGTARFFLSQTLSAGMFPRRTAWSDVDGDGDLDLAAATFDLPEPIVRIFPNDGTGRFGDPDLYPLDFISSAVAFADMDGDGDEDLLWTKAVGRVCVSSNEDGIFVDERCIEVGRQPEMLALADLDGDGDVDVATPDFANFEVYVLENAGDGTLEISERIFAGEEPREIAAVDIDGDGDVDLTVPNARSDDAVALINNGNGGFGGAQTIDIVDAARDVIAADVDGDGDQDLLVASPQNEVVRVLRNDAGVYAVEQVIALAGDPVRLAVGDLDQDGDLDAVVATERGEFVEGLINDGPGAWRSTGPYEIDGTSAGVVLADADGDQDLDALVLGALRGIRVAVNDGGGVFEGEFVIDIAERPTSIAAGRLVANGQWVIAVSSRDDGLALVYGLSDRALISQGRYSIGRNGQVLAIADVTADGNTDLIVSDADERGLSVWLGDGRGRLGARSFSEMDQVYGRAALGDFDEDGSVDLALLTARGAQVLLGDSAGRFAFSPALTVADNAQGIIAADLDADGRVDVGVGDIARPVVHVLSNGCPIRCAADLDGDGELTIFDFLAFQNLFDAGDLRADFDGDAEFTLFDFLAFQNTFDAGCD